MKNGNAVEPSGLVSEIVKSAVETAIGMITDVDRDEMQFGFMLGCGTTTNAVFMLREVQEKYVAKNHNNNK